MDPLSERLPLAPSEVHVWVAPVGAESDRALARREALLAEEERAELARLLVDERRRLRRAGRVLRRLVLSCYADIDPAAWRFRTAAHGRPEIAAPAGAPPLRFSVAHTTGLVACAVALGRAVGVDIEVADRPLDVDALARRLFANEETAALARLDPFARRRAFLERWTLKEALLKACGTGLALPPAAVIVRLSADGRPSLAFAPPLDEDPAAWHAELIRPTDRHILAVVARRDPPAALSTALRWIAL